MTRKSAYRQPLSKEIVLVKVTTGDEQIKLFSLPHANLTSDQVKDCHALIYKKTKDFFQVEMHVFSGTAEHVVRNVVKEMTQSGFVQMEKQRTLGDVIESLKQLCALTFSGKDEPCFISKTDLDEDESDEEEDECDKENKSELTTFSVYENVLSSEVGWCTSTLFKSKDIRDMFPELNFSVLEEVEATSLLTQTFETRLKEFAHDKLSIYRVQKFFDNLKDAMLVNLREPVNLSRYRGSPTTTGALIVKGGVGVSGALTIAGGVGIAKNLYVGHISKETKLKAVQQFCDERLESTQGASIGSSLLYSEFFTWNAEEKDVAIPYRDLAGLLKECGMTSRRTAKGMVWDNVSFKETPAT